MLIWWWARVAPEEGACGGHDQGPPDEAHGRRLVAVGLRVRVLDAAAGPFEAISHRPLKAKSATFAGKCLSFI